MANENKIVAKAIFQVSQRAARIQKHQKTIKAHNVSPAYVETKAGARTSRDRERSPQKIVITAKTVYNERLRFILVSIPPAIQFPLCRASGKLQHEPMLFVNFIERTILHDHFQAAIKIIYYLPGVLCFF